MSRPSLFLHVWSRRSTTNLRRRAWRSRPVPPRLRRPVSPTNGETALVLLGCTAAATLERMLEDRLVGMLAAMCEGLLESSKALAVSLVDERLREIVHAGAELPADLELPRPAQELLQHLGKHRVFTMPVAVGLLVIVFGNRSSLGLVHRCARDA